MRKPREYCGTIHRCGGWLFGSLFLLTVIFVLSRHKNPQVQAASTVSPSQLDVLDDGKQLKLLVRHREVGPICELWCYEGGPFRYGTASKREDGSVVFVHTSGKLIATTTFTPSGEDRILMDILLDGPAEEMKEVTYMGPCMQFWHSDGFKQQENLVEFARRCFLYTMRGPVGLMDTARGPMKGFKPDAPENNPPYTQWYVPTERPHPGDIWAFGPRETGLCTGLSGWSPGMADGWPPLDARIAGRWDRAGTTAFTLCQESTDALRNTETSSGIVVCCT
jgi:hypothetical protein